MKVPALQNWAVATTIAMPFPVPSSEAATGNLPKNI